MINNKLSTEKKILQSAISIFILYGYHGTTIQVIADNAIVNKSVIHYYFRSKENLYNIVVKNVIDNIPNTRIKTMTNQTQFDSYAWFLLTELYNNKALFVKAIMKIYPFDWQSKLAGIMKSFSFSTIMKLNLIE